MAEQRVQLLQVKWNIFRCAECPVCSEYMAAPILQCSTGHSICIRCKGKLEKCPICNGSITGTRNFALENMIGNLPFPCSNSDFGCEDMIFLSDKAIHNKICPYRLYDCLPGCTWQGRRQDILDHMEEEHENRLTKEEKADFYYRSDFTIGSWDCQFISAHGEIFRLENYIDDAEKTNYISVHFIGPQEYCSKYSYTISFTSGIDCNSQPKIIFTAQTHPDYIENIIEENVPCFSIRECVAKRFTFNETLQYSVEIIKST